MCNQISQEFMGDIVAVTSGTGTEDDSSLLEEYLLQDRGWMLLHVIRDIGVKGLCSSRDLCNLLVSLLPWCCQFNQSELPATVLSDLELSPISHCFSCVTKLSKLKSFGCEKEPKTVRKVSENNHGYRRHKRADHEHLQNVEEEDSDTEVAEGDRSPSKMKPARFKRKGVPVVRPILAPKEEDCYSDDDILTYPNIVKPEKSFSAAELVKLVLDIINELSKLDLDQTSPGKSLSSSILPHLLHLLNEQFSRADATEHTNQPGTADKPNDPENVVDSSKMCSWPDKIKNVILSYLLRSIFTVSSIIATHQHGVRILVGHGLIQKLFDYLSSGYKLTDNRLKCDKVAYCLVEDVINGTVMLFEIIFQHLPFNPTFINEAIGLMDLFAQNDGFNYMKYLVEMIDIEVFGVESKSVENVDNIVKFIGNLINTLKILKVNYVHAVKCLKHRHRNCDYSVYYDHHHGILGMAASLKEDTETVGQKADGKTFTRLDSIKHGTSQTKVEDIFKSFLSSEGSSKSASETHSDCAVAVWSGYLLDLVSIVKNKRMQVQLLTTLSNPGVCCCLQPKSVINVLVPLLPQLSSAMSNFYLETLINLLLNNFQGITDPKKSVQHPTSLCQQCFIQDSPTSQASVDISKSLILDSGFSSSDLIAAKKQRSLQRWRPLRQLRDYVLAGDNNLALVVSKQLIVLAVKGNNDIKEELFFGIYQQVLKSIVSDIDSQPCTDLSSRSSSDEQHPLGVSVPSSTMLFCVSALPYVLHVDKVMKAFLGKQGLSRLHELIEDEQLRGPVLGVFEALIMIDEQTIQNHESKYESSELTTEYTGGSVMQNFIDVLARKTCMITSAFQRLHITSQLEKSGSADKLAMECQKWKEDNKSKTTPEKNEECPSLKKDGEVEAATKEGICQMKFYHQDMMKHLPVLLDMWLTCAKLCINSPTFRMFYKNSPCLNLIVKESLVLALELLVEMGNSDAPDDKKSEEEKTTPGCNYMSKPSSFSCHQSKLAFIEAVMIVCFSCQTISPSQKRGSEEEMWMRLMSSLRQCTELEPTKLRALFDMLLNAALPQIPSILEYSYPQIVSMLNLKEEDWIEEDELRLIRQQTSESDQDYILTEYGYEADTEGTIQEDWKKALDAKMRLQVNSSNNLCFPAVFRLFIEMLVIKPESSTASATLVPGLLRLLQVLKNSRLAVEAVCSEGLLEIILDGFKDKLICKTGTHQDIIEREVLLSLIQLLAQQQISARELNLFLKLFRVPGANIDCLLSMFLGIVENSSIHPSHMLEFPVPRKPDPPPIGVQFDDIIDTDDLRLNKHDEHQNEIGSAIQCPLKDGLTWPPLQTGFSISMWINAEVLTQKTSEVKSADNKKPNDASQNTNPNTSGDSPPEVRPRSSSFNGTMPREYTHILSLGNPQKRFEMWLDTKTTALVFRITTAYSEPGLLVEVSADEVISFNQWQHLVISYKESLDGSTQLGKLTLTVNGWIHKEFHLDHPASAYKKNIKVSPSMFIGCLAKDSIFSQSCRYMLGNIMLFKGCDFSEEWWFHLFTLGLNCSSFSKCDCVNTRVIYSPCLNKDVVCNGNLSADILVGSAHVLDIDKARSSLLLTYLPRYPESASYFGSKPQTGQSSLQSGTAQDFLLFQIPTLLSCSVFGELHVTVNNGFEKAAEQTGGIGAFIFLVAKIYESTVKMGEDGRKKAERLQSKAIRQLFVIINRFPRLAEEFMNMSGYGMLRRLLTSSRSIVGYEILKTLLDACTSESIFKPDASCTYPVLRKGTEAIIRDIGVVDQLLLHWRVWEYSVTPDVVDLLFKALQLLVREDHPLRDFNIKQFQAGNVLNKIFSIYLERIQENLPSLSVSVSESVSEIVEAILGSPPDLHMLMAVTDFLLLVHPAANSFINYKAESIYFKSSWAVPNGGPKIVKKTRQKNTKAVNYDSTDSDSQTGKTVQHRVKRISDLSISSHGGDADLSRTDTGDTDGSEKSYDYPKVQTVDVPHDHMDHVDSDDGMETNFEPDPDKTIESDSAPKSLEWDVTTVGDITCSPSNKRGDIEYGLVEGEESPILSRLMNNKNNSRMFDDTLFIRFDDDTEFEENNERGLASLCTNLLNYLSEIVQTLPDSSVDQTFSKILNPSCLIVLAQNPSPHIKTAVINLLGSYLLRAPVPQQEMFLKMDGFHLLANQLHLYPAKTEHVEAAISILLGQTFFFESPVSLDVYDEVSAMQQASTVLLLSLVEKTADDLALCHNTLTFILQLIQSIPVMSTILIDHGLGEVMCNLLSVLSQADNSDTDIDGIKENQMLFIDIQNIFCALAIREFSWSAVIHYQQLDDLFNLLKSLENTEISSSKRISSPDIIQGVQIAMLTGILEYVEGASEDISKQSIGWFSAPNTNSANQAGYGKTSLGRPSYLQHHQTYAMSEPFQISSFQLNNPQENSLSDTSLRSQTPSIVSSQITDNPYDDRSLLLSGYGSGESDSSADSYRRRSRWASQDSSSKSSTTAKLAFFGSRRKKLVFTSISHTELLERFKKILVLATDLIIFLDRKDVIKPEGERSVMFSFTKGRQIRSQEDNFLIVLFNFTYRALEMTLEKNIFSRKNKNVIMSGAKDVIRVQLGRLLLCLLSPKMEFDQRVYVMSFLMGETKGREILKLLVSNQQASTEVCFSLYNLLSTWHDWLTKSQREHGYLAVNILRMYGCSIYSPDAKLTQEMADTLTEDKKAIDLHFEKEKKMWSQKRATGIARILTRFEKLEQQISDRAMEVTQTVTQLQNQQRKKLINHIKKSMTAGIHIKKSWQELVQNLTHERAVWFHEESYPISWQLDPTEGPGRMRKRVQRCHLGIPEKFLTDDYKKTLETEKYDAPLKFLFEDDHQTSDSAALIYRLYTNEKIQHTCRCMAVSPSTESKGDLLVGEMCIFFVGDEAITDANYTQVLLGNKDELSMTWPHANIRELHKRWYQLQDVGLEIFLTNGKTCLLAFTNTKERDELYVFLQGLELPNLMVTENLDVVQQMWLDGLLTNYDYLIYLNKIAGRSFSDLMQYPVFPFILREYESDVLDLEDASVYRDLSKPIAVQDKSREKKYGDNYEFLQQEYDKNIEIEHLIRVPPYHYGSHYSNSGTVLHYLVRLPPFTQMFLSYQDGSFDIPDRTFHSTRTSWRLSSYESQTDVKELIPEFFFLPDFFKNVEGFNFGRRQNGEVVWDVSLPSWCKKDARLFILIHRQALESAYVSRRINHWIDLVFGYKQKGEMAKKSFNVFHPSTYFGMDVGKINDPLKRHAMLTMIKTYGQTPKQLFRAPHVSLAKSNDSLLSQIFSPTSNNGDTEERNRNYIPRPINSVSGLKWGNYVGSPDYLPPVPTWREVYPCVLTSLVPLASGFVFGVPANSCVLVLHSKDRGSRDMVFTSNVMWAAILSWKDQDGVLRISNQLTKPTVNFLIHSPYDEITCCASVPDCHLLFIAGNNGVIDVYTTAHNSAKVQIYIFNWQWNTITVY
ncbi:hypothetical protein SNE40_010762 [Patella caerulea]|uniref:Lysosomal-trafficking regulator n=1 Tax=Patella caerulea TaxID=87958 RepID=A0AAN8K1M9_PATCE